MHSIRTGWLIALCGSLLLGLAACGDDSGDPSRWRCEPEQPYPYPSGIPYVGVHANPANNDRVQCDTAASFREVWHALEGYALAQPNTFSPDGEMTYVTTSQPTPGACNLHALRTADGSVAWCRAFDTITIWSAVEVDLDGLLYLTTGSSIVSLDEAGDTVWELDLAPGDATPVGAVGLHFTPDGHIATVTEDGTVLLVSRTTGERLASLSIPAVYGFVPPKALTGTIDLGEALPESVVEDFGSLEHREPTAIMGVFSGAGAFADNTVAVAPDGTLYSIGGGPDEEHGALVQIRVGGTSEAPTLTPGWYVELDRSSASSPSISPDGAYVKFSDGNSPDNFLTPEYARARTRLVDIGACDRNEDSEPAADRCGHAYAVDHLSGPILGASPLLDDAVHYSWEVQLADLLNTDTPDLRAFQGETLLWELLLPDDLQWTSVITVSNTHLIGTGTRLTDGEETLLTIELPGVAESELLVVNRHTGKVAFRAPISDDATSTVTIGPDGSLYVTMLCLVHSLSVDTRPVGGIIRFAPR